MVGPLPSRALLTAFMLGLIGSLHCVGMCGAIALALPHHGRGWASFITGRVAYNLGRVATYSALGQATAPVTNAAWVLSASSKVYHFANCATAAQIAAHNRRERSDPPPGRQLHTGRPTQLTARS